MRDVLYYKMGPRLCLGSNAAFLIVETAMAAKDFTARLASPADVLTLALGARHQLRLLDAEMKRVEDAAATVLKERDSALSRLMRLRHRHREHRNENAASVHGDDGANAAVPRGAQPHGQQLPPALAPGERAVLGGMVHAAVAGDGWRMWTPHDPAWPRTHPFGKQCVEGNLSLALPWSKGSATGNWAVVRGGRGPHSACVQM